MAFLGQLGEPAKMANGYVRGILPRPGKPGNPPCCFIFGSDRGEVQ